MVRRFPIEVFLFPPSVGSARTTEVRLAPSFVLARHLLISNPGDLKVSANAQGMRFKVPLDLPLIYLQAGKVPGNSEK
jgi:hypothetical protein